VNWFLLLIIAAGVGIALRVYMNVRRIRNVHSENWDEKVVERLRAMGTDPFSPHDVVFFFALPSEAACQALRAQLETEGYVVETRGVSEPAEYPFSLHASKTLRLDAVAIADLSKRFRELARAEGGRYDSWTAGIVSHTGR